MLAGIVSQITGFSYRASGPRRGGRRTMFIVVRGVGANNYLCVN